jgi:hypothetical protein
MPRKIIKIGRPKVKADPWTKCGNGIQLVTRKDQPNTYNRSNPLKTSGKVRWHKMLAAIKALGLNYTEIQIRIIEKHWVYIPSVKNITEYCRNELPMSDDVLRKIMSVINEHTRFGYRCTLNPPIKLSDCKELCYGKKIDLEFVRIRRDTRIKGKEYNRVYNYLDKTNVLL